jgi:hypothetical protein
MQKKSGWRSNGRNGFWGLLVLALSACARVTPAPRAPRLEPAAYRIGAVKQETPHDELSAPSAARQSKTSLAALPSAAAREPAPAPTCDFGEATDEPPGFSRTDPWPKREVVLTFDDGPHPYATPRVLKLLARHHFTATFFVVGHSINGKTAALLKQMIAEGHSLGSHSYNHDVDMGFRDTGENTVQYIRGQHETTQILIELALLSESERDFDAMFTRVFAKKPGTWLSGRALRDEWPAFVARHAALLEDRGHRDGSRPYRVRFSRPPGGGPYLGATGSLKRPYTTALARAGMFNVMWHGESGDTNAERKRDSGFLEQNLSFHSRRGGIVLIHDHMRHDALTRALDKMAKDEISVISLEQAVERKFGCGSQRLPAWTEEQQASRALTRRSLDFAQSVEITSKSSYPA